MSFYKFGSSDKWTPIEYVLECTAQHKQGRMIFRDTVPRGSRILEGFDKEVKELRSYFWKNCVGGPQKPAKEPKVKYWGGK